MADGPHQRGSQRKRRTRRFVRLFGGSGRNKRIGHPLFQHLDQSADGRRRRVRRLFLLRFGTKGQSAGPGRQRRVDLSGQNETPPDVVVPRLRPDAFVAVQLSAKQPVLQDGQQFLRPLHRIGLGRLLDGQCRLRSGRRRTAGR